jgi:hypothetical protein
MQKMQDDMHTKMMSHMMQHMMQPPEMRQQSMKNCPLVEKNDSDSN